MTIQIGVLNDSQRAVLEKFEFSFHNIGDVGMSESWDLVDPSAILTSDRSIRVTFFRDTNGNVKISLSSNNKVSTRVWLIVAQVLKPEFELVAPSVKKAGK